MDFTRNTVKRFLFVFPTKTLFGRSRCFFAGLLVPCGFAPFHLPGLAIMGIALLFAHLNYSSSSLKKGFLSGFSFGLSFFGLGISWVYVSIHEYGHLNLCLSALITSLFVVYLSLFTGLATMLYQKIAPNRSPFFSCCLFSALWCLSEFLRANLFGGFPWLQLGFGQIDTPLKYILPIVGIYGVSFITCLSAACLTHAISTTSSSKFNHYKWLLAFITLLLTPLCLKNVVWTVQEPNSTSISVIQANLSMRDKWDEALFWKILNRYDQYINQSLDQAKLIVLPESAFPIPATYISDFLDTLHNKAKHNKSAILLGIPQPATLDEKNYYNSLISLGHARGQYLKQHLVPFGEFIPPLFQKITNWLSLSITSTYPGKKNQSLVHVHKRPIASLICYELAYPELLRQQLPEAQWIVSISDDGWFGHSLAMYQQVQMAQALSILTGRYQIVANNDGLSSLIDSHGEIVASLPAFSTGVLHAALYPVHGSTPWVSIGDRAILALCLCLFLYPLFLHKRIMIKK